MVLGTLSLGFDSVDGNVTDSTNAVLPDVSVTAVNTGTGTRRTGVTSSEGNYRITEPAIGMYKVSNVVH